MDNPDSEFLTPTKKENASSQAQAKPQIETGGAEETEQPERLLFFNVMPKLKSSGQIVEPKLKTAEQPDANPKPNLKFMEFFAKYKIYIISFLILAIAGPAAYFAINKFIAQAPAENLLNPNPSLKPMDKTAKEWQKKYFGNEACQDVSICGDSADPDHDGLTNLEEFKLNADPNNPDSDKDGLADGDEVNVFQTDPLDAHTAKDPKYNDADFIKGGYNIKDPQKKYTNTEIADIKAKMDKFGLHQPSLLTLDGPLQSLYHFGQANPGSPQASSTPASIDRSGNATSTVDQTLGAKQDRDAQRSLTIKNIGIALIKYQADNQAFPAGSDFLQMFAKIKPYLKVAANPGDPINSGNYVYSYSLNDKGDDFTLSYYSEVANQIITKHAQDAQKDKTAEEAEIFDNQRRNDIDTLRTALLLYSSANAAGNQNYVFPAADKYKIVLVTSLDISAIPKDPKTGKDYDYQVSDTFDSFTLKAILDNPKTGTTGYLCNQEECHDY